MHTKGAREGYAAAWDMWLGLGCVKRSRDGWAGGRTHGWCTSEGGHTVWFGVRQGRRWGPECVGWGRDALVGAVTHGWGMGAAGTLWKRCGWAMDMVGAGGPGTWVHAGDARSAWGRPRVGHRQECGARGTKGWAVEGHPNAVTCQYASGAMGHVRAACGHGHGVWGDPEWPVGRGTQMAIIHPGERRAQCM